MKRIWPRGHKEKFAREAAAANWKSFQDDPEWKSVHDKSEANGKLVDFSPTLR